MRTIISLSNEKSRTLPARFQSDDVRYTDELVEHFLNEFTSAGGCVLDPFMGFGTTLIVCERMDRIGYGIEYDADRCSYVQNQLKHPERALVGDSTKLSDIDLPLFDFCITSPPYMGRHHSENPFTAYSTTGQGYETYLSNLQSIYRQVKERMKPGSHVVIEVANLKHDDAPPTPLAWDIAAAVSGVLSFQGEIVVAWQPTYGFGYDHSYCLIFKSEPGL